MNYFLTFIVGVFMWAFFGYGGCSLFFPELMADPQYGRLVPLILMYGAIIGTINTILVMAIMTRGDK